MGGSGQQCSRRGVHSSLEWEVLSRNDFREAIQAQPAVIGLPEPTLHGSGEPVRGGPESEHHHAEDHCNQERHDEGE